MNKGIKPIIIYTEKVESRIRYVLEQVFNHYLGLSFELLHNKNAFEEYIGPKIAYSNLTSTKCLQIFPSGLLCDGFFQPISPKVEWLDQFPFFFKTKENQFPFDIFSCIFFMLSRYEEYHSKELDEHGRFIGKNSLAYKEGFIEMPVVEIWIDFFWNAFVELYPECQGTERKNKLNVIASYDIDMAYNIRHRGVSNQVKTLVGFILKGEFVQFINGVLTLLRVTKDIFDVHHSIKESHKVFDNIEVVIFFLVGENGKFDKNLPIRNKYLKQIIRLAASYAKVGLHPSYRSNKSHDELHNEYKKLNLLVDNNIDSSRQHYLKLSMPNTFQQLIALGIKEDHTMGYADLIGYRAGTGQQYYWYDLINDTTTQLKIVPFQWMDVSVKNYLKLTPNDFFNRAIKMAQLQKKYGGYIVSLWHNSSFTKFYGWDENWQNTYWKLMKELNLLSN